MDNLGAIAGPLLALPLVAVLGVRGAIVVSVIPGLLAALAILQAVRHLPARRPAAPQPIRLRAKPVLKSPLRRLAPGITLFELGNLAATLLILRAATLLETGLGSEGAAASAVGLYALHNLAATGASFTSGRRRRRSPSP